MFEKINVFQNYINTFETEEIKNYCIDMINKSPEYIWKIPSSTSFKYHNKTQCQPGGQLYHILMACEIMNYILGLKYIKEKIHQPKKRDCLRTAILLHDMQKTNGGQYTVHEHPIIAQKWIEETVVEHDIDFKLKQYIGRLVASHSGEWTTSNKSSIVLPEIENDEQFIIHLCDYLGSRNNIDMIYSDEINNKILKIQEQNINDLIMPLGKYKGEKIINIDKDYLKWAFENMDYLDFNIKNAIKELI